MDANIDKNLGLVWIGFADLLFTIAMAWIAFGFMQEDTSGPYKQRRASWWLVVLSGVAYPLISVVNAAVVMLNVDVDNTLSRNCTIGTMVLKLIFDLAGLFGTQWHWRSLREHTSPRGRRWLVTFFSEILTIVWMVLVIAVRSGQIKSKIAPAALSRSVSSPVATLALVTNVGLPLVNFIPLWGLLIEWTKVPDYRFEMKHIFHNPWAMSFLCSVLLYTGANTWLVVFAVSCFGNLDTTDPLRIGFWWFLQVSMTLLGWFNKFVLVDSQHGSSRVWSPQDGIRGHSNIVEQSDSIDEHIQNSQGV